MNTRFQIRKDGEEIPQTAQEILHRFISLDAEAEIQSTAVNMTVDDYMLIADIYRHCFNKDDKHGKIGGVYEMIKHIVCILVS